MSGAFSKFHMFLSHGLCCHHVDVKSRPTLKKMLEANTSKVGHGPQMGQNGFDSACVTLVLTFIPLLFDSSSLKPVGWDVLACFGPFFFY